VNSSEGLQIGVSPDDYGKQGAIVCGLMLLGLYLVFDSFTSQVCATHCMSYSTALYKIGCMSWSAFI
jgi:hypothetical protein